MGLSRRNTRFQSAIWPGFVDAMTGLLLVLMFVLMIFMLVQSVLRETITGQESELDSLTKEVSGLTTTLNLEREDLARAQQDLQVALGDVLRQRDEIANLMQEKDAKAALLQQAQSQISGLKTQAVRLLDEQDILLSQLSSLQTDHQNAQTQLTQLEKINLAEQAAAQILQDRLENSTAELSVMTLALEEKRKEAEETLTLLAAARAMEETAQSELDQLKIDLDLQAKERGRIDVLLAQANEILAKNEAVSAKDARQTEALNQQVAALRLQVKDLKSLLEVASETQISTTLQVDDLGEQLNLALAKVASEERRRRELEEAERLRLEEEAQNLADRARDLERFKSNFFGELRKVLEGQERVKVQGDRFIFSSEVLFNTGQADLSQQGRTEISNIASILASISQDIPKDIDWIIRVDGHTDNIPVSGRGDFRDNWELSQARALSVVRYMVQELGLPPTRLSANGFGEHRPLVSGQTEQARAANRRIELKLTER